MHRRSGRGWEARRVCAVDCDVSAPVASQNSQAACRQFARGGRRVRCFNCGDVTRHMAADCPRPRLPKRCHYCKVMPHKLAEVAIPNLSDYLRDSSHGKCSSLAHLTRCITDPGRPPLNLKLMIPPTSPELLQPDVNLSDMTETKMYKRSFHSKTVSVLFIPFRW